MAIDTLHLLDQFGLDVFADRRAGRADLRHEKARCLSPDQAAGRSLRKAWDQKRKPSFMP